jgi:DNA-directed RNA polymerase subunit L
LMYNHYIREKKPTEQGKTVSFVGYICPHPLETEMILRMVIQDSTSLSEYVEAFAEQCRRITSYIQQLEAEWLRLEKTE